MVSNAQSNPSAATPSYNCPQGGGSVSTALNVNGAPRVLKAAAGAVINACVMVAGSAAGGVFDCTATANATTAAQVGVLPATVGNYTLNFPCLVGVTVVPGTGQKVSLSYQ